VFKIKLLFNTTEKQVTAEAQAFFDDLANILINTNSSQPIHTETDYPGKEDGLPFEWWEDDSLIGNNIVFNLDDDPNYQGLTEQEKLLVKIFRPALALVFDEC